MPPLSALGIQETDLGSRNFIIDSLRIFGIELCTRTHLAFLQQKKLMQFFFKIFTY